jgi:hypothetical protein
MNLLEKINADRTEAYSGNSNILWSIMQTLQEELKDVKHILDIASDKNPEFIIKMAKTYSNVEFTHLRSENRRRRRNEIERICREIPNIKLAYSDNISDIKKSYDLAIGFFTMHEIADINKGSDCGLLKHLDIVKNLLTENGRLIIIDYDLCWFKDKYASKKEGLKKFKGVFTAKKEREVLKSEEDCIENHTRMGLNQYGLICENAGIEHVASKKYCTRTSFGINPKIFLYVGKVKF